MHSSAVHRFEQVRRFFQACRTRRADFVVIGDSNTYSAGDSGLTIGFADAWGRRFNTYATGVHATNSQGGFALDHFATFGATASTPLPDSHAALALPIGGFPYDPIYFGSGTSPGYFSLAFAYLQASHPNGFNGNLRWWFDYATFSTGDGVFQPCVRLEGALSYAAIGGVISTNTGTDDLLLTSLSVPAGARGVAQILGQFQTHHAGGFGGGTVQADGPFASFWTRWEWPDIPTGVAVGTLLYQGGQPTRAAAASLQSATQAQFNPWCRAVVTPQGTGEKPVLCVHIIQGQNDGSDGGGGDSSDSLGPNPTASNTPAGCADNHAAIVNRLRTFWTGAGHDPDDLYFLVGPYHPQQYTRRKWCRDVDDALRAFADTQDNVAVVTRSRLSSSAYFTAKGWYAEALPSDAHLTSPGYHHWATVAVNAVVPPAVVLASHDTGASLDLVVFDEAGQVFDTVAGGFGPWDDDALSRYIIAGVEQGTSGVYRFTIPAMLPAHAMGLTGRVSARADESASLSDTVVAMLAAGEFDGVRRSLDVLENDELDREVTEGVASLSTAISDLSSSLPDFGPLVNLDAPVSRAGSGAGATLIDHNTGGTDALRYVDSGGAGVSGAAVRAYVKADFDAGLYVERGHSVTRTDGRWLTPIYLDAAVTYTITLSKPGVFQVSKHEVEI